MLDGKVLTAVFVTLTGVAAALGGGSLDTDNIKESSISAPGDFSYSDLMPDTIKDLDVFENPEPETSMSAQLYIENIEGLDFRASGATIETDIDEFDMDHRKVSSEENFVFKDSNTNFNFGNNTVKISGTTSNVQTSNVNITGMTTIEKEFETEKLVIKDIERTALNIDGVRGDIDSGAGSTTLGEYKLLSVDSYSGDISIYLENNTLEMDGKVHRLEAGPFSLGS